MFNNRNKFNFVTICCWLSVVSLSARCDVHALSIQKTHTHYNDIGHGELTVNGNGNGNALQTDATVPNFSPRLEYNNEWRPVGRGDPLKNDPTYDYSPPVLERVRYWRAENESKDETSNPKQHKKDNPFNGKKEVLLLGMATERQRGKPIHSETSVLQPKYTSIRRSYYAHQHQLPTHLMPPPMQTLASPANLIKTSVTSEYRHNRPSTTTTMSMMHSKPFFSTSVSSPWMHSSVPTSVSSSPPSIMQHYSQQSNAPHMIHDHDRHRHESIKQFTYNRPNSEASFTPHNFIESNQNSVKQRKPWLHELLQKEVVKVPPKTAVNKYSTNYEHMLSPLMDISTTHPPVAFVPLPTTTTPQTPTSTSTQVHTTTSPVYFTTTMATATTTPSALIISSPITSTSNRLLIPTTSNLIHRPTVTPMEMTTDALFKHYKQPVKPLLGPMYLIIEGHSKVKTYGKDELDPHRPKIVPVIPNREPVVRIADPNEKRGTLETFQVKHLHSKVTAPVVETTQSTPSTPMMPTRTTIPTTSKNSTNVQPTKASVPTNTTTMKTSTTVTTTTSTPQATNKATNQNTPLPKTETPTGDMQGFFNFLDSSLSNLFHEDPTAPEIEIGDELNSAQQKQIFVTTTPSATILHPVITTTKIKPNKLSKIEARIGSQGSSIESLIDIEAENVSNDKITTEPVPRDVRQIFDYDQLPESRLTDRMDITINEDEDNADTSEEGVFEMEDDHVEDIDMEDVESLTRDEYEDENHDLIKRIDKLVDDIDNDDDDINEEPEFEELISDEVDLDDELEMRHTKET